MRVAQRLAVMSACLSLAFCATASARQSASTLPATSDPQAVALLQQSLTALTGSAPITDVTMSGSVIVNHGATTETGTITMVATAAGQSQITVALPSGKWVTTANYAVTPRTSVTSGPNGAKQTAAPEELLGPSPAWFCPALVVSNAAPQAYVASYVDQGTRDGSPVSHIAIWPATPSNLPISDGRQLFTEGNGVPEAHLGQQELYLDSSSHLPKALLFRIRGYLEKNGGPDPSRPLPALEEVQFSNYHQVQGRSAAFHIQMSINRVKLMDIQLSSVSFNTGAAIAAQ